MPFMCVYYCLGVYELLVDVAYKTTLSHHRSTTNTNRSIWVVMVRWVRDQIL